MATNITTGTATTIASNANAILITVNAALTGTIVVAAGGSSQYATPSSTIATITNPVVGSTFPYGGLAQKGAITVTPSGACDITVSVLNKLGY